MAGLNAKIGEWIGDFDHLVQSVNKILTTRVGTRVMRREFGSDVPSLLDAPGNEMTIVDTTMAVAIALDRWEPRFELQYVNLSGGSAGIFEFDVNGIYRANAAPVTIPVQL